MENETFSPEIILASQNLDQILKLEYTFQINATAMKEVVPEGYTAHFALLQDGESVGIIHPDQFILGLRKCVYSRYMDLINLGQEEIGKDILEQFRDMYLR